MTTLESVAMELETRAGACDQDAQNDPSECGRYESRAAADAYHEAAALVRARARPVGDTVEDVKRLAKRAETAERERDEARAECDRLHAEWRECADALAVAAMQRDEARALLAGRVTRELAERVLVEFWRGDHLAHDNTPDDVDDMHRALTAALGAPAAEPAAEPTPAEDGEPALRRVVLTLCDACIDGKGGECHTPGCAMWLNRAPDLSIRNSAMVESIDGVPFDYDTLKRAAASSPAADPAPVTREQFEALWRCTESLLETVNWANNHAMYDDDVHDNPEHDRTRATVRTELKLNREALKRAKGGV